ncbi:MAG: P-loop NTPase [Phycisphaerae bacterium]|nr:P-loop NTPase [Phycisphaerae bacterium]MDW8260972.1 P-loop NTPase [Phycisphaerales bacterium]
MTQEIIATSPRGTLARPDDAWATGANTALAGYNPNPPRPSPLKTIHRLLRGRILLAIVLGTAGLIAGALYGWSSTTPKFVASGLIEVAPYFITRNASERTQGYFLNFVKSQPAKIANSRTAFAALNRDEWKAVSNRPVTPEFVGSFLDNLSVDYVKDTFILRVSYQDVNPQIAAAAVDAVMKAFVDISQEVVTQSRLDALRKFEDSYAKADAEVRRLQDAIRNLSAEFGTDKLDNLIEARQRSMMAAEAALREVESQLELATNNKTVDGKAMPELTMEDMAVADAMMRYFVENRTKALFNLVRLSNELGANHPQVQRAQREYAMADRMATEYFDANKQRVLDVRPNVSGDGGGQVVVTPKVIETLKQYVEARRKRYEQEVAEHKKLAERNTEIRQLQDLLKRAQDDLVKSEAAKEDLEFQLASTGRITITSEASVPSTPSKDRRAQFALIGGLTGGALPVGLLMLIGLLDSRYRYSEETTETQITGLTLLGILPNLPDRLSDPGQASIAAHCVHQVRTRLQIDAPVDGPVAYSVTSASSGDGKTSLTLALGLSFAASGSRTLLVDCDLVGAGLTARLNMAGPQGILDAITTRQLMPFVKNTDVSDLMMLPAGNAQLQHAGVFSPAAMKRLINEAKKHFEVVLIDTGPILGSIEATPVCSAVDGVILTVARGQQRPLVEKALTHLRSIGARISGVVFNRAQARDFEQSISGISLRSAARSQNGHGANGRSEGGHYGSLAKAVASSTLRQDPEV